MVPSTSGRAPKPGLAGEADQEETARGNQVGDKMVFLYFLFCLWIRSVEKYFLFLRIQFKLDTALLSYCPFVCPSVTGVTSHISHIYKGINAMLIIKPYIF